MVPLFAALLGALVGGSASLGTSLWSLSRTRQYNRELAEEQHRRARRSAMAQVSIWADLGFGPRLLVLNNSGEPINGLQVELTLLRATSGVSDAKVEGATRLDIPYVPPSGEVLARPLPSEWQFESDYDNGTAFCISESKFQDALGDFWKVGASGEVSLSQTADEFNAELLAAVESPGFSAVEVKGGASIDAQTSESEASQ